MSSRLFISISILTLLLCGGVLLFKKDVSEESLQDYYRFHTEFSSYGWRRDYRLAEQPDFVITDSVDTVSIDLPDGRVLADEVRWSGILHIEQTADYRFNLASIDGSWLQFDGRTVIDNRGTHPMREMFWVTHLDEGYHFLEVGYEPKPGHIQLFFLYQKDEGPFEPVLGKQIYQPNADFDRKVAFSLATEIHSERQQSTRIMFEIAWLYVLWQGMLFILWRKRSGQFPLKRITIHLSKAKFALAANFVLWFSASLQIHSMVQKSATWDEDVHLTAGVAFLKTGRYELDPTALPLVRIWNALPLMMFAELPPNFEHYTYQWTEAYRFMKYNDVEKLLFWSRMFSVFVFLALGWLIYLWGRKLAPPGYAMLAVILYAFDPNFMAHSRIVTSDVPSAFFFTLTLYFFYRLITEYSIGRLLCWSLAFSGGMLTKFSFLVVLPIHLVIMVWVIWGNYDLPIKLKTLSSTKYVWSTKAKAGYMALALVCLAVVLWACIWTSYGFSYRKEEVVRYWDDKPLINGPERIIQFCKDNKLFPEAYLVGLTFTWRAQGGGAAGYLLGQHSFDGWWYYFLVALLVKTPLPVLLIIMLLIILTFDKISEKRAEAMTLVLPALLFFAACLTSRKVLGVRYILPIFPLLYVFMASAYHWWREDRMSSTSADRKYLQAIVVACCVWLMAGTLQTHPHYLPYFNEATRLLGGGINVLGDSNLDWGQDLKLLGKYMKDNNIEKIKLSYFGRAMPNFYQINYDYRPSAWIIEPQNRSVPLKAGEIVAVSVTNLQHIYVDDLGLELELLVKTTTPFEVIGKSIYLYRAREREELFGN